MSKTVLTKIELRTLPNGYSLEYAGKKFMYFNELDLLAGFNARVGAGETAYLEKGDVLKAVFDMMLGEQYARDIEQLNKTVLALEMKYNDSVAKLERELIKVEEANEKHEALRKKIKELTELTVKMKDSYKEACAPYEEYERRIFALEGQTKKVEDRFKSATKQTQDLLDVMREKLDDINKDEKMISSKANTLIKRLDFRIQNLPDSKKMEDVKDEEQEPQQEDGGESVAENVAESKKRGRKKRASSSNADDTVGKGRHRQKADEMVEAELERQMKENPNIK